MQTFHLKLAFVMHTFAFRGARKPGSRKSGRPVIGGGTSSSILDPIYRSEGAAGSILGFLRIPAPHADPGWYLLGRKVYLQ
jgi:hypothetical protein